MSEEESNEEDKTPYTASEIEAALHEQYGDLLDVNQDLLWSIRARVTELEEMKKTHAEIIGQLDDCQQLLLAGAKIISNSIGDLVVNEWRVSADVTPDDDEGEGEESDDDAV